jgi:Phosphodiester glycosidase
MNRLTSTRVLFASALALVGASALTSAQAQIVSVTPYTPIYQGINEATATIQASAGTAYGYVMQINLDAPGIGFTTTPLTAGGSAGGSVETKSQTTAQFLQSTGAQVAINANTFNTCCSTTAPANETLNGLAVSNGQLVSPDAAGTADLLLAANNQASMVAGGTANLSGVANAIAGFGYVVQDGVNVASGASGANTASDPRMLVGLSQNDQYLYLVAIDSGSSDGNGVTGAEEANVMLALGVYNGINLDGGGSTSMVVQGANGKPDVLESPYTGAERYDGNNLGVYAQPLAPVPLPPLLLLFGSAALGLMAAGRRRLLA